jgi:anti-anti-sigma factor
MDDSAGTLRRQLLSVEVTRDSGALVIRPIGELDIWTTQMLDAELRKAIATDAREVFLDLGGLSFIDSTGVRLLVLAATSSCRNGSRLRMLRGSAPVDRVLQVSGLDHSLPFID